MTYDNGGQESEPWKLLRWLLEKAVVTISGGQGHNGTRTYTSSYMDMRTSSAIEPKLCTVALEKKIRLILHLLGWLNKSRQRMKQTLLLLGLRLLLSDS